jgi:hypothetical protein
MVRLGSGTIVLAFFIAGCGGSDASNEAAAGNNQAAAAATSGASDNAAAGANAAAPGGNASADAGTPVGPCPFATRGWTATILPGAPGEQTAVGMNGEIRADDAGRLPTISTQGRQQAPVYVIELLASPEAAPQPQRDWMPAAGLFESYTPAFTYAAVRCGGVEIARVPIRAG